MNKKIILSIFIILIFIAFLKFSTDEICLIYPSEESNLSDRGDIVIFYPGKCVSQQEMAENATKWYIENFNEYCNQEKCNFLLTRNYVTLLGNKYDKFFSGEDKTNIEFLKSIRIDKNDYTKYSLVSLESLLRIKMSLNAEGQKQLIEYLIKRCGNPKPLEDPDYFIFASRLTGSINSYYNVTSFKNFSQLNISNELKDSMEYICNISGYRLDPYDACLHAYMLNFNKWCKNEKNCGEIEKAIKSPIYRLKTLFSSKKEKLCYKLMLNSLQ